MAVDAPADFLGCASAYLKDPARVRGIQLPKSLDPNRQEGLQLIRSDPSPLQHPPEKPGSRRIEATGVLDDARNIRLGPTHVKRMENLRKNRHNTGASRVRSGAFARDP